MDIEEEQTETWAEGEANPIRYLDKKVDDLTDTMYAKQITHWESSIRHRRKMYNLVAFLGLIAILLVFASIADSHFGDEGKVPYYMAIGGAFLFAIAASVGAYRESLATWRTPYFE